MNMNEEQSPWEYTGGDTDTTGDDSLAPVDAITWEASEYIAHEKPITWYLILYGVSLALSLFVYIVTQGIVGSIAIMTMAVCLGFLASRPPQSKQYELSSDGIKINGQLYGYASYLSFSVVEEGAIDSIWIKPIARFKPFIVMYFTPEDEDKIIDVLSNFLPHEQRELDKIDQLSRRLRF